MSGKNRAAARQATKMARRLRRRNGRVKQWMKLDGEALAGAQKLVTRTGNGGTDKSGVVKPSRTYYSQATAERIRGRPSEWEGIPKRMK